MEKYGLLFESIFKRKLTDENAVSYLENLTKEHPYFSVAQFYLLQLSQKNTNGYKTQAKKTAALFNNNHWLNFQLLEAGYDNQPAVAVAPVIEPAKQIFADKIYAEEKTEETVAIEMPHEQPVEIISDAETIIEEEKNVPAIADETIFTEPVEENNSRESITQEKVFAETEMPVVEVKDDAVDNETKPVEEAQQPLTETAIEIPVQNEPLLFEPLHTSDYFASVGIKLSEEEKSSDKLGKQLKSFTDWLKTMKKVHTVQLAQTTAAAEVEASSAESSIQKLAEKSNQENDVITEAMADVLFQQGRHDKAIEILEKLSLLNPSKNAYFASKINQIKEK